MFHYVKSVKTEKSCPLTWRATFLSADTRRPRPTAGARRPNKSLIVRTSPETHSQKLLQHRDRRPHKASYSVQTRVERGMKSWHGVCYCCPPFLSFYDIAGERETLVYQSRTFKRSRHQESRKLKRDSMIDVSVNVSGEVTINNTVARSFSQIPGVKHHVGSAG